MSIIDLTHPLTEDMPVYPGTPQPIFKDDFTIEKDGFREKKLELYGHMGTHIDAPAHILREGKTLDQLPITQFQGKAFVFDFSNGEKEINVSHLEPYKKQFEKVDFILVNTNWDKFWGKEEYYLGYPLFSAEAVQWLRSFNLKGYGFDNISADEPGTTTMPIHKEILGQNAIIIENLTNLDQIKNQTVTFYCLPIKIVGADGSPVRAIAITD